MERRGWRGGGQQSLRAQPALWTPRRQAGRAWVRHPLPYQSHPGRPLVMLVSVLVSCCHLGQCILTQIKDPVASQVDAGPCCYPAISGMNRLLKGLKGWVRHRATRYWGGFADIDNNTSVEAGSGGGVFLDK